MYGMLQQHAAMLAFVEAFWVMGVVFLLMIPFVPLLRYRKHGVQKPGQPQESSLLAPEPVSPDDALEFEEEAHLIVH